MLLWILFSQRFGWNMDFWVGKNRPGYAKQRYSYFSLIRSIKCNYWLMSNIEKRAFSMKITLVCPCMCKRDKTKCILVVLSLGGKIAKYWNFDPSWKWWFFPSTKTLFEHLSKCSITWAKRNIPGGRRHVGATGWKYPSSELHLLDCNNTIYQEVLSCANKNQ